MRILLLTICIVCLGIKLGAQNLPHHWQLDELNHELRIGDVEETGIFDVNVIDTIFLEFESDNWFSTLSNYYSSGDELDGTLIYDGNTYEQVGVSFKGQTSYMMTNGEEKKSFNIRMNANIVDQTLGGYDVLNLNNCFDDASFLREFIYLYLIRHHIPAASCAFVELVINGESWGLYPMVQQMEGTYIKEWFQSNDGSRWRADAPTSTGGPGGPGGPQWGDGTAALNYLGSDITDYQQYYTLKSSDQVDPWGDLVNTCDLLNNTSTAELPNVLPSVLDVDRTLWFLACENVFGDDDSYIFKGKMDYYLYWEPETGRMVPLEFDGNSILVQESLNWGVFYHSDNENYPLLNKMLAVPEYRQRYLAHFRTLIEEIVDPALDAGLLDQWGDIIDPHVAADTKKLYSYNQFVSGVTTLNSYLQQRRNTLMNNTELNTEGAGITDVLMEVQAGTWQAPVENEEVVVTASVTSADGLQNVYLYYSSELVGNFIKVAMYDDGNSNDGAANDGVFGGVIPGMPVGSAVRFYIEAIENNTAKTASYMPVGAEHDVYIYTVMVAWAASTDIVINEVMSKNSTTALDELSEYEDWIELYNKSNATVDLSGYYITDNSWNLDKWELPDGTLLAADEYLILWADEDSTDGAYHTNFKLSSSGETITLINGNGEIADQVTFGTQQQDMGLARNPNGIGPFVIQQQTFAGNNNNISVEDIVVTADVRIFPNPCKDVVYVKSEKRILELLVYNQQGQLVDNVGNSNSIDFTTRTSGLYTLIIKLEDGEQYTSRVVRQ